jgi:hypothetical protein
VSDMLRGGIGFCQVAYRSECGDHRLHERHCVSVHW